VIAPFSRTLRGRADSKTVAAAVAIRSGSLAIRGSLSRVRSELPLGEYFAGLFVLACASGLTPHIIESVRIGWEYALINTFGISAIIWIACIAGVSLVLRDRTTRIGLLDLVLGAGVVFLVILPAGPLSWIAVTGLSLYLLVSADMDTSRRGALILLATTVPMLWGRVLFHSFSNLILGVDASLVGWLLGTHRTGNLVEFADGSAHLVILSGCSSLANVSLAVLCWVTLSQLVCHREAIYDFFWCFLACALVVAANVTRITIFGLSQWHYATFHSPWADAVANVIILGLIVGVSALGVRRELFQRI
jgi:hypothetical protein